MGTKVELGDEVMDRISGFKGIAVARTVWLHGCERITVQPKVDKDGKRQDMETFDEPQMEVVEANGVLKATPRHGERENVGARQDVG